MTWVIEGRRSIQSVIVLIFLKIYHLKIFLQVKSYFYRSLSCIWTYEINRFKLSWLSYNLIKNLN